MRFVLALFVFIHPAFADPFTVHETASAMFGRMPQVAQTNIADICGAGERTNPYVFYCTTSNTIFYRSDFTSRPQAAYEMAHLLGHAVQVQHGVADFAFRQIQRRRDEEDDLRGLVERQVNCIAGVLLARAGQPLISIANAYDEEPFQNAHWGRNPVNRGPFLAIGKPAIQEWLDVGYAAADVAACEVGEFSARLLIAAQRS